MKKFGRRRIWLAAGVSVTLLLIAVTFGRSFKPKAISAKDEVPVVQVKRGDLDSRVFSNGQLRAVRNAILTAPPVAGGSLQISYLAHTGSAIKKDDIAIEFDPAEQEYVQEQSRSELMQAEQEIIKAKADAAVQAAKDKVELLKARFDVRRAELEVSKNELVSSIDANKNVLALVRTGQARAGRT